MTNPKDFIDTENGPGKFEGEGGATNYFWALIMDGDGESHYPYAPSTEDLDNGAELGSEYSLFVVEPDEAAAFPKEFKIGDTVAVWEDSQGFVNMCAFHSREYALKWLDHHTN